MSSHSFSGRAYLRADVSRSLGLGHISRAIAMAMALERQGIHPVILCRILDYDPGNISRRFSAQRNVIQEIHSEDEFIAILDREKADYLFIDLLEGPDYVTLVPRLKSIPSTYRTICFDSFFDKDLMFDVYVGTAVVGSIAHSNSLIGYKYFICPGDLMPLATSKETPNEIRRVLITFGGSDPYCITSVVVRILCATHPEIKFTVVVGPGFTSVERKELLGLAAQHSNMECALEPEHLGHLYLASDFAITSGGLTKFETSLFGIPSFIIANNQQEEDLSREFSAFGSSVFMGRADRLDLQRLIEGFAQLLAQGVRLGEMSRKGRQLLDIYGGERIVAHITKALS